MNLPVERLKLFFKINFFITSLFFLGFLIFNKETKTLYFTIPAAVSTAALLYLLYFILLRPFFRFYRVVLPLMTALFIVTNYLLLFDFFLFRIWKFHINAMVLNIIFSPAAYDSIQVGYGPPLVTALYFTLFTALELWLIRFIKRHDEQLFSWNRLFNKTVLPAVIALFLWEKVYYGLQNMKANDLILESVKPIPLYQPFTFARFASRYLGIEKVERKTTDIATRKDAKVHYPLEPVKIGKTHPVPIFIFGSDAVRTDMITQEIMPSVTAFSRDATFYRGVITGGNCTRFGLFSFFYGLNAPYWFAFLHAKKGPVLFDVLKRLQYQIGIFYSTDTRWPEFRQTIFYDVKTRIHDHMPGAPWQMDATLTEKWLQWIDEQNLSKPIFSFVFLDAPHGRSYPQEAAIFQPDGGGRTNYTTASAKDRKELFNQYKNAIHYDDALLGKMLDKLKRTGLYDRSVIVFMSDHGEEFFEHGHFSHNNAFDKEQTNSSLIVKLPGHSPKSIDQLASSIDFIPSLLKYLGVRNALSTFSNAQNMFSKSYHRTFATCGNWYHNAIITPSYTFVFSNLPNEILKTKVYKTDDYSRVYHPKGDISKIILEVLNENRKFIQ
ncbi:sulfatase-like hydrolase/transferase [Hydrogenimonas urashimensis]|uniref:sulfatase-like hydrolase/transferase n=1 Tax=Hydrogenimonas urashimensis TaxID=2740515 RepID=UPI0019153BE6|nr:sulfatase-like hydrolase/transferase [Hydrogenimonas urashimensis]